MDNWYVETLAKSWGRVFPSFVMSLILAVSLVILFAYRRKNSARRFLSAYCLTFLAVFICPPAVYVLRMFLRKSETFWRMLWLLPWAIAIAAAAVMITQKIRPRIWKGLFAAAFLCVIIVSGNLAYAGADRAYTKADNPEKVPAEALEVVRIVQESEESDKADTRIAAPMTLTPYIRQIDGTITMPYGRIMEAQTPDTPEGELFYSMEAAEEYVPRLLELLTENRCEYAVLYTGRGLEPYIRDGARQIGSTENYTVWKISGRAG